MRISSNLLKQFVTSLLSTAIVACSIVPEQPDYAQQIQQEQSFENWSQQNTTNATQQTHLNDLLTSPELDQLLNQAYQNNPNLQQTWLTLQIRKQQLQQAESVTLPQLDAGYKASRGESTGTLYTGSISLDWQLDLWGKLDDSIQAANYDIQQQQIIYQLAKDTLTAEIMSAWLTLIAQQHAINIQQERVQALQQDDRYIVSRYRNGIGSLEDLDNARSALASAKSTLESYQFNLRQQQRDLKSLVGDINMPVSHAQQDYPTVGIAFADLPEQTLAGRPDLQAAFYATKASENRTKVAYKSLLPSLNIGASLEQVSRTPSNALLTSPQWSLLGELSAPIFHGGELRSQAKQAELETAQSYQSYRDTLFTAVNEIEQALDLERSLQQRQQHTEVALNSLNNSLTQYKNSYREGLVDILDLLIIQKQTYDLQAQLDDLTYQRLVNRINLGLALGLGTRS